MPKKVKGAKDYKTTFEIKDAGNGRYVLLAVLTKPQATYLIEGLHEKYQDKARSWRGQYQAFAQAIERAYKEWQQSS